MALSLPHGPSAATPRGPLAELADAVTEVPLVNGGSTRFVNFDYAACPTLAAGEPAALVDDFSRFIKS